MFHLSNHGSNAAKKKRFLSLWHISPQEEQRDEEEVVVVRGGSESEIILEMYSSMFKQK